MISTHDGKRAGQGTFNWVNGDSCEGRWNYRVLVGKGIAEQGGRSRKCYDDKNMIKRKD